MKAGMLGDLFHGEFGMQKQVDCLLQTQVFQVFRVGEADRPLEPNPKIIRAHMVFAGKLLFFGGILEVFLQV